MPQDLGEEHVENHAFASTRDTSVPMEFVEVRRGLRFGVPSRGSTSNL
jgi:hypothetical protein